MKIGRLLFVPLHYLAELRVAAEEEAFYSEGVDVCHECGESGREGIAASFLWCCVGFAVAISLRAAIIRVGL